MFKYIKYYITTLTLSVSFIVCANVLHGPSWFLLGFSLFLILGDYLLPKDQNIYKYNHSYLLDIPSYVNLPILFFFIVFTVTCLSNYTSQFLSLNFLNYFNIDIISLKNSLNLLDKFSLIVLSALFIGIMGTVPAHELTHRKNNPFDMFIGNALLGFSWDCAFAVEHVYGHHKNVALPKDPASAKRGESLYGFIFRAIKNTQIDALKIESSRLKRRGYSFFSIKNRVFRGYAYSIILTAAMYLFSGLQGMIAFLCISLIAKSFLEAINYIEHYGLVRAPGSPVRSAHSWNSNHYLSSIYLCNVTRHSSHHEKSSLKYWELNPYKSAPKTLYGYLSTLYLVLLFPWLYRLLMKKKLAYWDNNFASQSELDIIRNLDANPY